MLTRDIAKPISLRKHLRVLHIGPVPPPVGGMSTVLLGLSAKLQNHCETKVFNNTKTTAIDRTLPQAVIAQLRLLWRLGQMLKQWKPDIVHIHTCSNFTFWRNSLDLLLADYFGCKTTLHIHGGRFHHFLAGLNTFQGRLAKFVLGKSDCVIVLGQVWQKHLVPWCRPGSIEVIANGINIPDHALGPNNSDVAHIVCIANYEPNKGLDDLIRAAAGLPTFLRPWRISFLGPKTDEAYLQSLQQLAQDLGVEDRIHLPGAVSAEQITEYLRSAYVFCLPSHHEGLPMSMLEAMANALPVVMTRVGAIPEAVDDGVEALLYHAGDFSALSAALARLLGKPDLAESMGKNGRQRLIRDYSLETMTQHVLKVYQQLLSY